MLQIPIKQNNWSDAAATTKLPTNTGGWGLVHPIPFSVHRVHIVAFITSIAHSFHLRPILSRVIELPQYNAIIMSLLEAIIGKTTAIPNSFRTFRVQVCFGWYPRSNSWLDSLQYFEHRTVHCFIKHKEEVKMVGYIGAKSHLIGHYRFPPFQWVWFCVGNWNPRCMYSNRFIEKYLHAYWPLSGSQWNYIIV